MMKAYSHNDYYNEDNITNNRITAVVVQVAKYHTSNYNVYDDVMMVMIVGVVMLFNPCVFL